MREDSPVGVAYLNAVTTVLQRRRLAQPHGGGWEAADLQWWWPQQRHDDPADARVWHDDSGPAAAVVFSRWSADRMGCDVLADSNFRPAWAHAALCSAQSEVEGIDMVLPDDDAASRSAARRAGFTPSQDTYAECWLDPASRRKPRRPLPGGYRIAARLDHPTGPHPLARRNGARVEEGLAQCSLYDPHLDLAVFAPDGAVGGYGLFWPDLVTGVGLVEPMRIEAAHTGQGLASQLLDAGLRGLAALGCTRFKVSFEPGNAAAERLYPGAGFAVSRFDRTWVYARP